MGRVPVWLRAQLCVAVTKSQPWMSFTWWSGSSPVALELEAIALAFALSRLGDHEAAWSLSQDTLTRLRTTLGPDDPEVSSFADFIATLQPRPDGANV